MPGQKKKKKKKNFHFYCKIIVYQMGRLRGGKPMKYQALRPQFFSVGGWGVVGWVLGWVVVGSGGGAEWWRGGGWCD